MFRINYIDDIPSISLSLPLPMICPAIIMFFMFLFNEVRNDYVVVYELLGGGGRLKRLDMQLTDDCASRVLVE